MDRTTVNSLMDEASSGNGQAYAALASAVQDELFRFAIAQGLPRENAADATQDTFVDAFGETTGPHLWTRFRSQNHDLIRWYTYLDGSHADRFARYLAIEYTRS